MILKIAILEDNEDRRIEMARCLSDRFSQYPVNFFATAAEAIRFLSLHGDELLLIGLDHDLDMIAGADHRQFDPGTGRDVADFLTGRPSACPVVIHTTNTAAGDGMERVLSEAGWNVSRVTPYGDLTWIDESWFRAVRSAVVAHAGKYLPQPSAVRVV